MKHRHIQKTRPSKASLTKTNQLRTHLAYFMVACNFAHRLKPPGGLIPYEYVCKMWISGPDRSILNPIHRMPGLNS